LVPFSLEVLAIAVVRLRGRAPVCGAGFWDRSRGVPVDAVRSASDRLPASLVIARESNRASHGTDLANGPGAPRPRSQSSGGRRETWASPPGRLSGVRVWAPRPRLPHPWSLDLGP